MELTTSVIKLTANNKNEILNNAKYSVFSHGFMHILFPLLLVICIYIRPYLPGMSHDVIDNNQYMLRKTFGYLGASQCHDAVLSVAGEGSPCKR